MMSAAAVAVLLAMGATSAEAAQGGLGPDVREASPGVLAGKPLPLRSSGRALGALPGARKGLAAAEAGETPPVGTVKYWLALDDALQRIYLKPYTLRAVGEHTEVWVANDLSFPEGDCRNGDVTITDEQVGYLVQQFDENMYPKESAVFSVPPDRDGSGALITTLPGGLEAPAGYWGGAGDKIVTLIDNVRDDNYYDFNWQKNTTYIAGFHYSVFNEYVDRNVMTVDAFDWLHRTGANPPNNPSSDPCTSRPARPYQYEGTFAHEYQHLLEYYEDPDEVSWVNEGISDWAQTLTGYVTPSLPITNQDFDSHIQCFLGWLVVTTPANPIPRNGGPENSLTLWGDQGDDETLCDYGAAYSFMELVAGRYGQDVMTALHREDANGFEGLVTVLRAEGARATPTSLLHDWVASAALDGVLDRGARLSGRSRAALEVPTLDSTINWDNPDAYSEPGTPPNGADFVRLRDAQDTYLSARQLRSLTFDGAESLEPLPVEWTVDPNPEGREGNPGLYTGSGPNFDRAIVRQVDVPASDPTLRFSTRWNTEPGWDFAFVQVSTDGGRTYTSLANADTTTEHDPGADPRVVAQLPGFTGDSGGWREEAFDLSAYAGQSILLSFRYITDPGVDLPGWWIDDVSVGGTVLSDGSSLDGWRSPTQIAPVPVAGYTVQLVGYTSSTLAREPGSKPSRKRDVAFARTLRLGAGSAVSLDRRAIRHLIGRAGKRADVVAALVMQDDPTETVPEYARYTLTANGVVQPGG